MMGKHIHGNISSTYTAQTDKVFFISTGFDFYFFVSVRAPNKKTTSTTTMVENESEVKMFCHLQRPVLRECQYPNNCFSHVLVTDVDSVLV